MQVLNFEVLFLNKLLLYYYTIKKLRVTQVFYRLCVKLCGTCSLRVVPASNIANFQKIGTPENLDFEPVFLERFPVEELMENEITFLHGTKSFDWNSEWEFEDKSDLWNYNLHYFEYLFSLVKAWNDSGDKRYLDKTVEIIEGWIKKNPIGSKPAWASYPMSLRIVIWISYFSYVNEALPEDFRSRFLNSLHTQFVYLSKHLEKDTLGNHYFENLKSLVLAALFFNDEPVLKKALKDFKAECKEEILPDGMHFELSLMYHKIVLEGVLRVTIALRSTGKPDPELENYLQPMLDVAYSFEEELDRIPLFNDGGNNVAKSIDALTTAAKDYFGITPHFKNKLESCGFYIFEKLVGEHRWKLIVDAGQPGPDYIPGHAHCDAMSYELFCDGKPVIVNCGTYAYQCEERSFFRSTAAHNTVMANDVEQSQCWGVFRLAKRSNVKVLGLTDESISIQMVDQRGQKIERVITLSDRGLVIMDRSVGNRLYSYVHLLPGIGIRVLKGNSEEEIVPYAFDYGQKQPVSQYEICGQNKIEYKIIPGEERPQAVKQSERNFYKGYKPLAFLNKRLYLFYKGTIYTSVNGRLKAVIELNRRTWKDSTRATIRFFRREPKFAVPLDNSRMIIAGFRKLFLVDISTKNVQVICQSREGFSDPLNICKGSDGWLAIWGDYGANAEHSEVNIYGLTEELSVKTLYSFQPGQIRHVHNIIPRRKGGYYILTGDQEENAGIYSADIDFKDVKPVAIGKQQYRSVVGFDTQNGLLYATDAVNEQNYIYLLNESNELKKVYSLNGSCIYGTKFKEDFYFATTVEPDENNKGVTSWISRKRGAGILTDEVTLVKVDDALHSDVIVSYKKDFWPMKLMQYGSIQFSHGEGDDLWVFPVSVRRFDGVAIRLLDRVCEK